MNEMNARQQLLLAERADRWHDDARAFAVALLGAHTADESKLQVRFVVDLACELADLLGSEHERRFVRKPRHVTPDVNQ